MIREVFVCNVGVNLTPLHPSVELTCRGCSRNVSLHVAVLVPNEPGTDLAGRSLVLLNDLTAWRHPPPPTWTP